MERIDELEHRLERLEHEVSWLRRAMKAVVDAIKSAAGQMRKIDLPKDDGDEYFTQAGGNG